MNVCVVTLGCSKNEVDSEMILGYLNKTGFNITTSLLDSEVIIVNTCAFIASAKEEAISTILDMAEYKKIGKCKHLIVVGCLAKRYKKEIIENFSEVDLVIGVDEYINLSEIFSKYFNSKEINQKFSFKDRILSTPFPMAYLKISEGCNNNCTYCAIPLIRGPLKSRKIEDIIEEAKSLVDSGIREIVIISQDTSSYGFDIYGEYKLCQLLQELSKIEELKWIRVLYMYPGKITDDVVLEFKNNPKVCKYFDIPIQHISNKILKLMNRHTNKEEIYSLIKKIRKDIPNAVIRTTVITGFNNETKEDFNELIDAIKELKFERLGVFKFSKEEDTKAYTMTGDIEESIKEKRYNTIMEVQSNIMQEFSKKNIGKTFEVLVEKVSDDEKYFECRSYMEAPDVDPLILIEINEESIKKIVIGGFFDVKLIAKDYENFIAEVI